MLNDTKLDLHNPHVEHDKFVLHLFNYVKEHNVKDKNVLINAAVASVIALGLGAISQPVSAAKPGFEKCQGVAKAGMNDCGTSQHACAGQASADNDAEEWVYLPEGTCAKIAGGKVKG